MVLLSVSLSSGLFWVFMLIAFGVGYLVSGMFTKNKFRSELEKCRLEKSMLLNNVKEGADTSLSSNTIKAVQTRGRSGRAIKATEIKVPQKRIIQAKLNFEKIGEAGPEQANDLKQIDGIGPFLEKRLNEIGIYTYRQLSRLEEDDIKTLTAALEFFPGRIERDKWLEQAAVLAKKYPQTKTV